MIRIQNCKKKMHKTCPRLSFTVNSNINQHNANNFINNLVISITRIIQIIVWILYEYNQWQNYIMYTFGPPYTHIIYI